MYLTTMAALFADENELGISSVGSSDSTRLHYGLAVGLTVQAKSELKTTLVAFTPTPCDEARCPESIS